MEKLKRPQLNNKSTNSSFRLNSSDEVCDKPLRNQISMEDIFAEVKDPVRPIMSVEDIVDGEGQAKALASAEEAVNEQKNTKKKMWNFIWNFVWML